MIYSNTDVNIIIAETILRPKTFHEYGQGLGINRIMSTSLWGTWLILGTSSSRRIEYLPDRVHYTKRRLEKVLYEY